MELWGSTMGFYLLIGDVGVRLGVCSLEVGMCFDFLYKFLPKIYFILRRIRRDVVINVHCSTCKVPAFLVRF